jgi:tRNA threonylcarbamoyladenosine biosynthesis protein TsaB
LKNFRLLTECVAEPDITHSRRLMGSVKWVMESAGVSWEDLDGIGVSIGPGSFTGLRIGLAAAKAMAMATGKPLLGVPTLEALALACSGASDGRLVGVLLDARKKEVYAGFYRLDEDRGPVQVAAPVVVPPGEVLQQINEPVMLVGPGAAAYQELFDGHEHIALFPGFLSSPRAAYVGMLASRMLGDGVIMDPASAAPLYVRASEAELNLKRNK